MGWIDVNDRLPEENMRVRWKCIDGKEDLGYFYYGSQTFAGFDLSSENEITHWQPLISSPPKQKEQ